MKKLTVFLAGILILGFICSPIWAADVIRMRFGHVAPPMHAQHKASEYFDQYVEKESGGRIKCSTHPKGQLGSHIQMLEALQVGTLEVVSVAGPAHILTRVHPVMIWFGYWLAQRELWHS